MTLRSENSITAYLYGSVVESWQAVTDHPFPALAVVLLTAQSILTQSVEMNAVAFGAFMMYLVFMFSIGQNRLEDRFSEYHTKPDSEAE